MRKMGFSEIWIDWIIRCITSVKYKFLMNGEPRKNTVHEEVYVKKILCLLSY